MGGMVVAFYGERMGGKFVGMRVVERWAET